MPFTEALDVIFDVSEHGTPAAYTPAGYVPPDPPAIAAYPATVNGIFDNGFESALDEPGLAESQPLFTCRLIDVPSISAGAAFTIGSVDYVVAGPPRPDGLGVVRLRLREAT